MPESPRWLVTRGRREEAERIVAEIETRIQQQSGRRLDKPEGYLTVYPRDHFGFGIVAKTMLQKYRRRAVLGLSLMVSQAFLYNAIFFTYAMVLTRFYQVSPAATGIYLLPFALGNFLGPVVLGPLFDSIGRRPMISSAYALSGLLLALTGYLFTHHELSAFSQTALWTVIFFFASPAASSAYVTVSEIFPLEIRALAIAFFCSLGTAAGGVLAPWLFGELIGTGSRVDVFYGYLSATALMLGAAIIEACLGIKAERTSLEQLANPLSSEEP